MLVSDRINEEVFVMGLQATNKIRSFTYTEALIPVSRQIKLDVKDTGKEVES